MSATALRLAWHELHHGWRHFTVFLVCLALGVMVMASVGMLAETMKHALNREAQSLLGGDIEVTVSGAGATAEQLKSFEDTGRVSHVLTLRAMIVHQEVPSLVEVKAVDSAYPLLGTLELNETITPAAALEGNGIIVDATLLSQLGLALGDTVTLGTATYEIRATLKREPDRAVHIFSFGPRVMLRHEALEGSGLIAAHSLLKHHYRIALDDPARREATAEAFRSQQNVQWQIKTGTDGNLTLKRFLDQLMTFLTLCGLATFLISGIGISSSVRAYLARKSEAIAVMKILGASRWTILAVYVLALALLALIGCLIGTGIAYGLVHALLPVLAEWLPILGTARPSLLPALLAAWYGYLIVYLFSMPALLGALGIRPSLLFRSQIAPFHLRFDKKVMGIQLLLTFLLVTSLLLATRDHLLILGALSMFLLALALFGGATLAVRRVARRVKVKKPWLRLALGNLYRPGSTSGTVIFAIGISLSVLIALTLTEANIQARIKTIAQEKAPTLFLIDIQPHQQEALLATLEEAAGQGQVMMSPLVRGRITAINGKPVVEENVGEDVRWAVRGDRGISYSATPPANATLSAGSWWPADYGGSTLVSVDDRFLEGMGLKLGDTLTLDILGQKVEAAIANTRKIDYTTFQINFAMMLSPGVINDFPHSYIATVHLAGGEISLLKTLARDFPGITIIRTSEAVALVRGIVENVSLALRAAVGISLVAGLLVLASALGAMLEQRLYDTAVLKVLGARRKDILKIYTTEWMLLAGVTALIASALGALASWLIMLRFRGEGFYLLPSVIFTTVLLCILAVWLIGFLGNRQLFSLKPSRILRNE